MERLSIEDLLLIAEAVLGIPAERLAGATRLRGGPSAPAAPRPAGVHERRTRRLQRLGLHDAAADAVELALEGERLGLGPQPADDLHAVDLVAVQRRADQQPGTGLAALRLAAAGTEQAGPPPQPEVGVITLQPRKVDITDELPGRTTAFRVAEVRPQVTGIVLKRLFAEGSEVRAGAGEGVIRLQRNPSGTRRNRRNSCRSAIRTAWLEIRPVRSR